METRLDKAYRYCEWITANHYENFPVASWLLPRGKRAPIAVVYAFARSADDFADEGKYKGRSLELLEQWRAALRAVGAGFSGPLMDHPIFIALSDTLQKENLPLQLLDDLLTAFIMDVTKKRYANWDELMTYCRYSANPVGRLVLTVFGYSDPKLHELSDGICSGLQLANHWQDLSIDVMKDRIYVPQDLMNQFGVTAERLREYKAGKEISIQFRMLMKELVKKGRTLFDAGEPLIHRVNGRLRVELKLTLLGGRAILDRIEQAHYDVFRRRPVLSTAAQLRLLTRAIIS